MTLDSPPAHIPQGGRERDGPRGEAGVDEVQFFLGTVSSADDTAPVHVQRARPTVTEVGDQTLRAVVVDDAAQTAEDSARDEVDSSTPTA